MRAEVAENATSLSTRSETLVLSVPPGPGTLKTRSYEYPAAFSPSGVETASGGATKKKKERARPGKKKRSQRERSIYARFAVTFFPRVATARKKEAEAQRRCTGSVCAPPCIRSAEESEESVEEGNRPRERPSAEAAGIYALTEGDGIRLPSQFPVRFVSDV